LGGRVFLSGEVFGGFDDLGVYFGVVLALFTAEGRLSEHFCVGFLLAPPLIWGGLFTRGEHFFL